MARFAARMNILKAIFLFFLGLLVLSSTAFGQKVTVTMGPDQFAINQLWTITITVQNDRLRTYSNFPEIEGLVKRGTSHPLQRIMSMVK